MSDLIKLEEAIANGFSICGPIVKVSKIFPGRPNGDKTVIMLRKDDEKETIYTDDEDTILFAKQVDEEQDTPIGMFIDAFCEVLGTNRYNKSNFGLEVFVEYLNKNTEWEVKAREKDPVFTICANINSVDETRINEECDKIRSFVDILAVSLNIGIFVYGIEKTPIPKKGGPVATFSPIVRIRLGEPSADLISKISRNFSSDNQDLYIAANALNMSYIENWWPNRLSVLWGAIERIFSKDQAHIFTKEERTAIIKAVSSLPIFELEGNKNKLIEFKNCFGRCRISRNKLIATSISEELGLDEAEVYDKIKYVTDIRGEYVHSHKFMAEWEGIGEAEKYLQEILSSYISKNMA